ncbi:bifunctional 4-hydroxy-2-oxoglutarate aldolase/2-dehydro-3-deoxy-phosphogluconate aldolase [Salininema proteolyticum]|uniref:Bifunctional 4-hydroxy-2-oxoglutarate aldolase/2-dehydro-3-deoxy-phosphogluconate aldolase n=1 Tax=Salininema proteolyticum TaxID=1607685 RepID=A0ABV8TU09_9ACTN
MTTFDEILGGHRIMVILRGLSPEDTLAASTAAWDAGVEHVEVPIGEEHQVAALAAAVEAGADRGKSVGAGTVVSARHVEWAHGAGAAYTVAPSLSPAVAGASASAGMPHLPGVATPTEAAQAVNLGLDWVKVFPAAALGPAWFKAVKGPFPRLRTVATGGVKPETAPDYLAAGADVVGMGSNLGDPAKLAELL